MFPRVPHLIVIILALAANVTAREGVRNGSFEGGLGSGGSRPSHWNIGFPGDLDPFPGTWRLRQSATPEPSTVLEINCESDDDPCLLSQIIDLPAPTMSGATLDVRLKVRRHSAHGFVGVQFAAINPEAPVDPENGITHVGFLQMAPSSDQWEDLDGSVTLTGPAQFLAIVLLVIGDGSAASFDDVSVDADIGFPGCAPPPPRVDALADGLPPFPIGITNENPRNGSDQGLLDLVARAAETMDLVNLFVHIRWNRLSGRPILDGHQHILDTAGRLSQLGMPRMVTLDFTHDSIEGIGDLNPLPDGSLPGRLDDPGVTEAYLDELEALASAIEPEIVSVGIETDFFWRAHADQWPAFRDLLCEAGERLRVRHPGIHVTTYFTLSALVDSDGEPIVSGQDALRQMLPCIDSVGYSDYPADGVRRLDDIPDGYFVAASAVAPDLPLIVPEFGYRADDAYSEIEQEAFLRRVYSELAGHPVRAAVLYGLYDQAYFGTPPWFQEAFGGIGLIGLDGTPKRSFTMLLKTRRQAGQWAVVAPRMQCVAPPRRVTGRRSAH